MSKATGAASGAATGAGTGAIAGSAVSPGIGTAVGALGGALVGGIGGFMAGSEDEEALEAQREWEREKLAYQKEQDELNRAEEQRRYLRELREQGVLGTSNANKDYYAAQYKPKF